MNYQKYVIAAITFAILMVFGINQAYSRTVTVPVISATPIVINQAKIVKKDFCQPVTTYNNGFDARTITTILGAVIGSSIGNSNNDRRIATGLGAVMGNEIGARYSKQPTRETKEVCDYQYVTQTQKVIEGYKVVYDWYGNLESIEMKYHPGEYITIETQVRVR